MKKPSGNAVLRKGRRGGNLDAVFGIKELAKAIEHLACAIAGENRETLGRIERKVDNIMATQAELTADLQAVLVQQQKTAAEIASVQEAQNVAIAKIAELEALIAAGGAIGQELVDAVAAVKAQAQVVDDLIPDAPAPPVEPQP